MPKGKKETFFVFLMMLSSKVITYFLLLLLGNYFIKDSFGKASFVLSMYLIATYFCNLGGGEIFISWLVRKKDVHSVFYFLLSLNLLVTLLGIILSINHLWLLPLILAIPFNFINLVGQVILRSKHKYHLAQLFILLGSVATLGGVFIFRVFGELGILLGYSLGYFVPAILALAVTKKEFIAIASKVQLKLPEIISYVKKGFIISLIFLSFSFLGWIDSIILGIMSTFENVAKYNIAGPISNVITLIPISLSMFLLTRSAEEKVKKYSEESEERGSCIFRRR